MPQTILIADDQEVVRGYLESILRKEGFDVLEAEDGLDALRQLEQRGAPVDLLVTDIRMPRLDGIALARSIIGLYPRTPILYISGYSFNLREEGTMPAAVCAFLPKPFTRQALMEAVYKLLAWPDHISGATG